jgi:hypothetical protein
VSRDEPDAAVGCAVGCQSYESTNGTLPPGTSPGATVSAPAITFGVSWLVEILPRIEASALYDKLDLHRPRPDLLTAVENGDAGRSKTTALGGVDVPSFVGVSRSF